MSMATLASGPSCPGVSVSAFPKNFRGNFDDGDGPGQMKMDRGLIMFIEPIYYQSEGPYYHKKKVPKNY